MMVSHGQGLGGGQRLKVKQKAGNCNIDSKSREGPKVKGQTLTDR